jgi:hypothetical protein
MRKITEWSTIGMISKRRLKKRWNDEVLNDLKKLKVKNWTYLVEDRKAWYELVQKTKTHKRLCQQKKKNKKNIDFVPCL